MSNLKWTKTYNLIINNKRFKVFISENEGDGFYAGCLWYDEELLLKAPDQQGALEIKLDKRFGSTEDEAIYNLKDWIASEFGREYELVEQVNT